MSSRKNKPFKLNPAAKDYLWGGNRLNDDYNFHIPVHPFAEAWVCSAHPDGTSVVSTGEWSGRSLKELLTEHPEFLGTHAYAVGNGLLPILIKLIDAKRDLSVQVHPDDEYANRVEHSPGKTEMWYLLDARKGSALVYGFNQDVTAEQVRAEIAGGSISKLLNHVPVCRDDVFFVEAGTVHAIGAGCLIAEIQENSNITYRLYDYDRIDRYGQKRELHVEKALEVANLHSSLAPRQPMRVLRYVNGCASEMLARCRYFQANRLLLNTEGRQMPEYRADSNSFHVLLCVDGCGVLYWDQEILPIYKGDCVFVPADSVELRLHGKAQFIDVCC